MNIGSTFSGIEAATIAWRPMGWKPVFYSEIDKFPSAVLAHHHPDVPNLGDVTKYKDWPDATLDVLVGGSPCQSFSVAGLRKGLADPRGNLALTFLGVADRYRPNWLLWENVPGVLSQDGGRAFGSILGGMAELGYHGSYRVLDAQYIRVDGFGRAVPQRRRRVFVVGHLADWRRAAAVLFEPESLSGNPAPRRQAGENIAPTISARPTGGGGLGTDFDLDGGLIAGCLQASGKAAGSATQQDAESGMLVSHSLLTKSNKLDPEFQTYVAHSLRAEGFDASEDGTGRGTPLVPICFDTTQITSVANRSVPKPGDPCHPLAAGAHAPAIAFDCKSSGQNGFGVGEIASTLRSMGHSNSHQNGGGHQAVATGWAVRRLTPTECERLQGFPDGYTNIPWRGKDGAPDGPRYKALGNSMAVNVMRWIGRRIEMVEATNTVAQAAE